MALSGVHFRRGLNFFTEAINHSFIHSSRVWKEKGTCGPRAQGGWVLDPRWQGPGTREQEKRRQLAKKFYVAFRRGENDETRYARLAKVLPPTHREEPTSAGLQASNGQGKGRAHLRKPMTEELQFSAEETHML